MLRSGTSEEDLRSELALRRSEDRERRWETTRKQIEQREKEMETLGWLTTSWSFQYGKEPRDDDLVATIEKTEKVEGIELWDGTRITHVYVGILRFPNQHTDITGEVKYNTGLEPSIELTFVPNNNDCEIIPHANRIISNKRPLLPDDSFVLELNKRIPDILSKLGVYHDSALYLPNRRLVATSKEKSMRDIQKSELEKALSQVKLDENIGVLRIESANKIRWNMLEVDITAYAKQHIRTDRRKDEELWDEYWQEKATEEGVAYSRNRFTMTAQSNNDSIKKVGELLVRLATKYHTAVEKYNSKVSDEHDTQKRRAELSDILPE